MCLLSLVFAVSSDYCEECPANGLCYEGKLTCDRGFRRQGKLCVEDGVISRTAKKLVCITHLLFWFRSTIRRTAVFGLS